MAARGGAYKGEKKYGDAANLPARLDKAAQGKARGKYGGQNKVPRMDNSGQMTKDMANWFSEYSYF